MRPSTIDETIEETIDALQSELRNPSNNNKIAVVIEGDDDKKLYQKLFNRETAFFYIAGNWFYVVEATKGLSSLQNRIIGIKDADFDTTIGVDYSSITNLFQTDTHDAETLIINDEVVNNILLEYLGNPEDNIISKISDGLSCYSYLKLLNHYKKDSLGIRFSGFSIGKLFEGSNYNINASTCIEKVKQYANNEIIANFPQIADIEEIKKIFPITNPLILSNGHDLKFCFAVYITGKERQKGNKGVSGDEICRQLRINYNIERFRKTKLYRDIDKWNEQFGYNLWAS